MCFFKLKLNNEFLSKKLRSILSKCEIIEQNKSYNLNAQRNPNTTKTST